MIVGFTGTRQGMTLDQRVFLEEMFVDLKVTELHHGCCVGADEEANEIAKRLDIKTVGHPPTNRRVQSATPADTMLGHKPYIKRNHDIVNSCILLFVAPKSTKEIMSGSGTWATFRYANKIGRRVIMIDR